MISLTTLSSNRLLLALAVVSLLFVLKLSRAVQRTYRTRQRYRSIPALPRHAIWGNLVNMGEKLTPSLARHPDYAFLEVWESLGRPAAFLMDLEPVDGAFLIVADPSVAEPLVQPLPGHKYSIPKSDTLQSMYRLIGLESLILVEGDEWRHLRRRFNRGFAPAHLHSLDTLITSKTRVFVERLRHAADDKDVFLLKDLAQDLTTDIITELTIEKDFHAQTTAEGQGDKGPLGMLTASRKLSALVFKLGQGFDPLRYLDPIRPAKAWFYERIFDRELAKVIRQQIAAEQSSMSPSTSTSTATDADGQQNIPPPTKTQQKSITRLALSGLPPSNALIRNTVSQIKSFLFAGQDTTATLIQWLCYELSKASWSKPHAAMLDKLVAEHDGVFGKDRNPFNALDVLGRQDEDGRKEADAILGSKLPYTSAFIKETLRVHPPAATARYVPELSRENPTPVTITVRTPSADGKGAGEEQQVAINGLRVYNAQTLIHLNPAVWGPDAHIFRPDRWLDEEYVSSLPSGAWRPFERGPRNCIGQELAMLEAKVVMCAVARGFVWEKVGYSGKVDVGTALPQGDGSDDPERELWAINNVTAVPLDGMKMRVHVAPV